MYENERTAVLDVHSTLCLRNGEADCGGGDIADLRALADRAIDAGFTGIQVLPITDSGDSPCPYWSQGLFSYDPACVALGEIALLQGAPDFQALCDRRMAEVARQERGRFHHNAVRTFKLDALRLAYNRLSEHAFAEEHTSFEEFLISVEKHAHSFAAFTTLHDRFHRPWWEWEVVEHSGNIDEILRTYESNSPFQDAYRCTLFTQYILERQWKALASYVEARGAFLVMDKLIYPQPDSADVWANQHLFFLTDTGYPRYVSGCKSIGGPHGEHEWGHAVYRFSEEGIAERVMDFFVETVRHIAKVTKVIRLDHAAALAWQYYVIDQSDRSRSRYLPALGSRLLQRLRQEFPDVLFLAEDVGCTDPALDRVLEESGIPGMRCPLWAGGVWSPALDGRYSDACTYPRHSVALTDNHDTPSPFTWWHDLHQQARQYFFERIEGDEWRRHTWKRDLPFPDYLRWVFRSKAETVVTTLRTITGDPRRYNHPGTVQPENWSARCVETVDQINFSPIAQIIEETGRLVQRVGVHSHSSP